MRFKTLYILPSTIVAGLLLLASCCSLQSFLGGKKEPISAIEYKDLGEINLYLYMEGVGRYEDENFKTSQEFKCFANIVWHEARGDGVMSQQAVAQVVYNRYTSEDFPEGFCGVMRHRTGEVWQFSWMGDRKVKHLQPSPEELDDMSYYLASIYVGAYTVNGLEEALFFRKCEKPKKKWWTGLKPLGKIGSHCYYSERVKK